MRAAVHSLSLLLFLLAFSFFASRDIDPSRGSLKSVGHEQQFTKEVATKDEGREGPDLERWYFKQWHYPYDNVLPPDMTQRMWEEVQQTPSENDFAPASTNSWVSLGPFGMDVPGNAKYSGRILDIEVDNGVSTRLAAASGGLWGFVLIFPVDLTPNLSSLAIGTFDSDPTNEQIIFAGTGEPGQRGGTGLWRTTNRGGAWANVPLAPEPSAFYRVRFNPGSATIIHAVANTGYYRSTNSGTTWTRYLTGNATDLAINPTNPNIMYTSLYTVGLYKTTDGGTTWSPLTAGGIPTADVGRVGLTLCVASPNTVYASIGKNSDNSMLGVYKTTNAGTSWSNVSPGVNFLGNQGWYDNVIGVSPVDANNVLAGGVSLQRSTNGGTTWTQINDVNVHADHHAITWNSTGTSVWVGNDGGMSFSADAGATWSTTNNLVPITQYVNIDVDPNTNLVYGGGSQDNGISMTVNDGSSWDHILGGDGSGVAMDVSTAPADANRLWVTNGYYNGNWAFQRLRTTDNGSNWTSINSGIDPSAQWYHKIRSDRSAPVYLYNNSGPDVYESRDYGATWFKLSTTPFPVEVSNMNISIYTSPRGIIYAALNSSTLGERLRVYDGGAWNERSTGLPAGLTVRGVTPHPTSNTKAYALMNGLSAGSKIYKTTDRGVTWTNISGNIPNVPIGDIIAHPTNDNLLYLGTETGCFRTTNGGASWHRWNNGMPQATIVTEMKWIDSLASVGRFYIVAGTYGRGMYKREVSGDDPTSVSDLANLPRQYSLSQNYPNPFNPATKIRFALPVTDNVELKVFDITGREVATVVNERLEAGPHEFGFDASRLASGTYLYRLKTEHYTDVKKMLLIK
ncbi:MAG TPA: hypothetical protein DGH68_09475 [Bacteroidetes bacterium]|nr:hypothetical protein [Bacteroidota bacterium]